MAGFIPASGLGSAALVNTGTASGTVPLLGSSGDLTLGGYATVSAYSGSFSSSISMQNVYLDLSDSSYLSVVGGTLGGNVIATGLGYGTLFLANVNGNGYEINGLSSQGFENVTGSFSAYEGGPDLGFSGGLIISGDDGLAVINGPLAMFTQPINMQGQNAVINFSNESGPCGTISSYSYGGGINFTGQTQFADGASINNGSTLYIDGGGSISFDGGAVLITGSGYGSVTIAGYQINNDYYGDVGGGIGTSGSWSAYGVTSIGNVKITDGQFQQPNAALADTSGTIGWNLNLAPTAYLLFVHANSARSLGNPTNMIAGNTYTLVLTQSSTGTDTIASMNWGSAYKFPSGAKPTLSTAGNAIDVLTFYCTGTLMINTSFAKGVA